MIANQELTKIIEPYGGELVDLLVSAEALPERKAYASGLPSVRLSQRAVHDLELMAVGAFSPLDQFMSEADHQSVLDDMRLKNGYIFPLPITLPIDEEDKARITIGRDIALRSPQNELLAIMTVEEIYEWDLEEVALKAFGTLDLRHPLVAEMYRWGKYNISGPLQVLQLPNHYDFKDIRMTPAETRAKLDSFGHERPFTISLAINRGEPSGTIFSSTACTSITCGNIGVKLTLRTTLPKRAVTPHRLVWRISGVFTSHPQAETTQREAVSRAMFSSGHSNSSFVIALSPETLLIDIFYTG